MNRNTIPVYVVGSAILAYMVDYISGKQSPVLWISIITLWVSTVSLSRTGTIIAFFLFVLVMLYKIKYLSHLYNNKKVKKIIIAFTILAVLLAVLMTGIVVYNSSRYSIEGIMSNSTMERIKLIQSFLDQTNIKRAFTGFKFIDETLKDPHNSYLTLWSYCGIAAFPVFVFMFYLLLKLFKSNHFVTGLYFLILLYPVAEHVLFIRFHDYLIYTLFFYYFKER